MTEAKKLKPNDSQPNVFEYEDVGTFLNDWFEYLKISKKISLRQISKEADVSVGYLSMVLGGKRKLSDKGLKKLLAHLRVNQQERRFLELLHTIGESESPQVRVEAMSEMAKLSAYRRSNRKEHDTYKYLTKWYYVAIREMVLLPDFKEDAEWIQGRLRGRIGQYEVLEALKFLETAGLIGRSSTGKLIVPQVDLQCKEGVYKVSLAEFHRQVLDLAHKSIHEVARDHRYILGRTAAISQADFHKAKEIFDEALRKIELLGQGHEAQKEIYHFEFAAFPMTEKQDEEA